MKILLPLEENNKNYNYFIKHLSFKKLLDYNKNYNYWGNIPIEVEHLECLYDIYQPGMKFIDLGCGVGNVLRYAKNIGYDVTGIEFNEKFKEHLTNYDVLYQDVRKIDFNLLRKFDVIYSYKPLKNDFKEFIEKVKSYMKREAYLITPTFNI